MRRPFLAILLAGLLILAGVGAARAASLAGKWTATYKGSSLVLQLKGSGASYSGTLTFIVTQKVGKKTRTAHQVQPVKAAVKVVKDSSNTLITNVLLTFPKYHSSSDCVLLKGQLRCLAQATQALIVFKHVSS